MGSPLEPLVGTSEWSVREGGAAGDSCVPEGEPAERRGGLHVQLRRESQPAWAQVCPSPRALLPGPLTLGQQLSQKWHTVQLLWFPRAPHVNTGLPTPPVVPCEGSVSQSPLRLQKPEVHVRPLATRLQNTLAASCSAEVESRSPAPPPTPGCGGTWDEAQVQGEDLESLLGHLVAW